MNRALIVVDYQNDFVDGSLGFIQAKNIELPLCQKIKRRREEGYDILFTFDTHTAGYLKTQEGINLPIDHCIKGTHGWELHGHVAQLCAANDTKLEKPAFGSFELAQLLRNRQYELVELTGIVSNICVLSNAVLAKAALPEAAVVVDAGCTASNDPVLHEKALDIMQNLHIKVINR